VLNRFKRNDNVESHVGKGDLFGSALPHIDPVLDSSVSASFFRDIHTDYGGCASLFKSRGPVTFATSDI
jgi:hypothetical protein